MADSCKLCFWEEGGRCYVGKPERDETGKSMVVAKKKCNRFNPNSTASYVRHWILGTPLLEETIQDE